MSMRRSVGSPYINRFLQPDSIIPDQTNPQSWNRFSYVRNNPIGYNDPTGHSEDCQIGLGCAKDPEPLPPPKCEASRVNPNGNCPPPDKEDDDIELARQDRLFSLMFMGSGVNGAWTFLDWQYYYANRNTLWANPSSWMRNPDEEQGWDLFVLHVKRLASHYSADQTDQFVDDFALVFAGISPSRAYLSNVRVSLDGNADYGYLNEGLAGLDDAYIDSIHEDENASHHYAGIFYFSYYSPSLGGLGIIGNMLRDADPGEWNQGDINLGNVAAVDAAYIKVLGSPADLVDLLDSLSP
jgi:hypothetical protein